MKEVNSLQNGQDLKDMLAAATRWLEKSAPDIDALNVFPVPDGDTGTNMLLTMRSTMEEAYRTSDSSASAVLRAMAKGALMGARGNSGVILSQIFRGLSEGLAGKKSFSGADFAQALSKASSTAYQALSNPVEGTILTVMHDASLAAQEVAPVHPHDLSPVMESVVEAARDSVARTPTLLSVLRDAGVVDAGGQGLYILFEGILRYLKGQMEEMEYRRPHMVPSSLPLSPRMAQAEDEVPYGYCTNFLLQGDKLKVHRIRKKLERRGQSVMVVGDENTVRVHIHTFDPGAILRYVTSLGTLHEIEINNMDDQHTAFVEKARAQAPASEIATVAVVWGEGLTKVFQSLGATAIVPGGQTMNPSVQDLLRAVESVSQDKVILLPNNGNIVLTANQVQSLTQKEVEVVPTKTIPQGVAALLSFNYDADLKTNASAMEKAMSEVRTIEITRAVRPTRMGDLKVKRGETIALLEEEMIAAGDNPREVLLKAIYNLNNIEEAEVITIYYGADTGREETEEVAGDIRQKYPQLEVELTYGGQPHYNYIVSVE